MKLTLLLIPLIFLTSCTIDWNDEKDKKITELEKQVTELKSAKELELQKFEFEKQKYEEGKLNDQKKSDAELLMKSQKECSDARNFGEQKYADFINSCLQNGGSSDSCIKSQGAKVLESMKVDTKTCMEQHLSFKKPN